ncbi:MAG: ABC transporter ATP-binding protein [Frankia sp.]|nr:ABC transporter ATP-binding protein [Frankia sp.]
MLEVEGLRVSYGTTHAVRGIDLRVGESAERAAVALLGPNGAGKTSTLRAVSQLVPYRGTVRFDGVDLRGKLPSQVARLGLIHVPEGRHVFPTLTVHENLQMGLVAAAGRRPVYSLADVYDLFPALGRLRRRGGYALSGGEQQMVAIGRGLLGAPRLLLLDEPSLGLAPVVTEAVFAALAQVVERTPVLVVEQNSAMALRLCQTACVLVHGELTLSGTAAELGDRTELLASYLGQTTAAAARR